MASLLTVVEQFLGIDAHFAAKMTPVFSLSLSSVVFSVSFFSSSHSLPVDSESEAIVISHGLACGLRRWEKQSRNGLASASCIEKPSVFVLS